MDISIQQITEHEDGSATMIIDMDAKTRDYMINYAFLDMLRNGLKEVEALNEGNGNVEL